MILCSTESGLCDLPGWEHSASVDRITRVLSPAEPASPRPLDFYNQRAQQLRFDFEEAIRLRGLCRSSLVVLGLLACVLLYEAFVAKRFPVWTPALATPLMALAAHWSHIYHDKALRLFRLSEYYDAGIARLTRNWPSLDEGADFADADHFYATDLDLFGRGSMFQLLCSARTQAGRESVANWLKAPAGREEVFARHLAIAELRDRHDLREALANAGAAKTSNCRPETFRTWVAESASPLPTWARFAAIALVLTTIACLALHLFGRIPAQIFWWTLTAMLLIEWIFGAIFLRRVRLLIESVGGLSVELPIVLDIFEIVSRENFVSAKLAALANRMREGEAQIRHLRRLVKLIKERENEWFTYVSYVLLWGTQFAIAIDQWRSRHGNQLLEWLATLGEFEALISLSTYGYEHPVDKFPELSEEGPLVEAEGLAHPLLDEDSCVRNDLRLGGPVRFLIVSGSNMSGKSTFVRAIGLNTVLAWMGAPVRCTKLKLSAVAIGAAVRVQDSVVDGRSHFLAEMQRLRRMIDLASKKPLLYLADEIMSGTNSHDRGIATEWVVRALVLRGAIGVITTHDLALTEIASNGLPGSNVHFEDSGENGNLDFDYKLRSGLLRHSNALNIARMLGIDAAAIEEPDASRLT